MSTRSEKILAFNQKREPEILKIKFEAMRESEFRFYRATCGLFYERLSNEKNMPESPIGWICGDLHLENFGSYRGHNNLVYFDLNDFDEGIKAPVLWEVIRLLTSIFIAFAALEIESDQAMNMALLFIKSYSSTLLGGKAMDLDPRTSKGIVRDFLTKAEKSSYDDLLKKRTLEKKGKIVLDLEDERHYKLEKQLRDELKEHIIYWLKENSDSPYNYKFKDVVYRIAGTGSLGQKRYLFLLKSTNNKDNYLLVDMKQAFPSAIKPFLSIDQPKFETEAHRIISIQKRMQHVSASLLSTSIFQDEAYVMQELQPVKDTIKFKLLKEDYRNMYQVIHDMGVLTASSQLRSSGTDGTANKDELMEFASKTLWQEKLVQIAKEQAALLAADFAAYQHDYRNGDYENIVMNGKEYVNA